MKTKSLPVASKAIHTATELLKLIDTLETLRLTEHYKMYFNSKGKLSKQEIDKLWALNQLKVETTKVLKLYQD